MQPDIKQMHACKGHCQHQWNGKCHHQAGTEAQREKAHQQDNNHCLCQHFHKFMHTAFNRDRLIGDFLQLHA